MQTVKLLVHSLDSSMSTQRWFSICRQTVLTWVEATPAAAKSTPSGLSKGFYTH